MIFFPFANGYSLIYLDETLPPAMMLAARMLRSELFKIRTLADYVKELLHNRNIVHLDLQFAIELIAKVYELDNECGIMLVVDEINEV